MVTRCEIDPEKICDECGECDRCDVDPEKICDNCCRCIEGESDYRGVLIDKVVLDEAHENKGENE